MTENHSIAREINQETTRDVRISENVDFKSMFLPDKLMFGLQNCGFRKPSPIQLSAIPLGRCGFDLIVQSKSGTGKTLVFSIIALEIINTTIESLQVLILAPTREIAVQITDVLKNVGQELNGLKVSTFIGGLPEADDVKRAKNCHIAVGAPGRVKSLMKKGVLNFESVKLLIMDEVDKLFEKSFQNDINEIYSHMPVRKQVISVSATFTTELKTFLSNFMHSPTEISAESDTPLLLGLKQFIKQTKSSSNVAQEMKHKNQELLQILTNIPFTQCLIFSNYQSRAETVCMTLNREGLNSKFISAAQNQTKRLEVLDDLKQFKCRILISTDLTARGIDAANVDLIINYDVPVDVETYLHRMGRAGRYGSKGLCITLISSEKELEKLRKYLGSIGGKSLTISKLNEITSDTDLWDPQNEFEQINGIIEDQQSISEIKNKVADLKSKEPETNLKKKKEKVINNAIEELSCLDLNKSEENVETEKKRKRNTEQPSGNITDAEKTLESLARNEYDFDENTESDDNKKRKILKDQKNEIYLKNVAMYEVAKILTGSEEYNEYNLKSYLESRRNEVSCSQNEKNQGRDFDLDKIFVRGYEFALDNKKHWKEFLPENEVEQIEKNETCEEKNEEESCEDEWNDDDELEEDYDENYEAPGVNYDENGKRIYDYVEIPNRMVWLPVEESVLDSNENGNKVNLLESQEISSYQNIEIPQISNEQDIIRGDNIENYRSNYFSECFQECSGRLWQQGWNFNTVEDFDNWFYNWQNDVHRVREYVRQNLYVREMSQYQNFNSRENY